MRVRKMVIADSHQLVRSAIKNLILQRFSPNDVLEAGNASEMLSLISRVKDVGLLVTEGEETQETDMVASAIKVRPELKVIVLSSNKELHAVRRAFRQGASAYLFKGCDFEELEKAINYAEMGERYVCHQVAGALLESDLSRPDPICQAVPQISARELEILELIGEGKTNLEIAEQLFLSKRTVEGHRQSLLDKTNSRNSAQLIRFAVRNALIN